MRSVVPHPCTWKMWKTSQVGYLKLLISRSILSGPLDFEIKRVACISKKCRWKDKQYRPWSDFSGALWSLSLLFAQTGLPKTYDHYCTEVVQNDYGVTLLASNPVISGLIISFSQPYRTLIPSQTFKSVYWLSISNVTSLIIHRYRMQVGQLWHQQEETGVL